MGRRKKYGAGDGTPWIEPRVQVKKKLLRLFFHLMGWIGIAVVYYIAFSFFFDTPVEYRMKRSTEQLRRQYTELSNRYDTIENVLRNVIERDRNVFNILFEAEPYDLEREFGDDRFIIYENLLGKSDGELGKILDEKTAGLEKKMKSLVATYRTLAEKVEQSSGKINYIPSIQPVINNELTLLTASFGMRIHPFYKTLSSHQGVDYTVPEGSRVFATADGVVMDAVDRYSSSGLTVIINHGNGYQTQYSHLDKVNVKKGQQVRRGDIIGLSGNTGLSLAPHLHYEVRHNGMRVDPIHYFFMELSPSDYQKIQQIARSGMQSFD